MKNKEIPNIAIEVHSLPKNKKEVKIILLNRTIRSQLLSFIILKKDYLKLTKKQLGELVKIQAQKLIKKAK